MIHAEDRLQRECVRWFSYQYPQLLLHHSPNGGFRTASEAGIFKAMGVQSGFPDLMLLHAVGGYHGLFLEMKDGRKGRLSESQKKMLSTLQKEGYACCVCRSFEDFTMNVHCYLQGKLVQEDYSSSAML